MCAKLINNNIHFCMLPVLCGYTKNDGRVDPSTVGHYYNILDNNNKKNIACKNYAKFVKNDLKSEPCIIGYNYTCARNHRLFEVLMMVVWLILNIRFCTAITIFHNFEGI